MQTIVDHHHASDQKQATKVRFSEPGDEESEAEKVRMELNENENFSYETEVFFATFIKIDNITTKKRLFEMIDMKKKNACVFCFAGK